jgi:hypothetical protein
MNIRARSAWTSTAPGGLPLAGPVGDLFIHHTAGVRPLNKDTVPATIRATREFHINERGMSDIAYSYAIDPWGRVWTLRGHRTGGHTFNHNSTSIAFVFLGASDSTPKPVLDAVARAMGELRQDQLARGNLTPNHGLRGHRDVGGQFGPTECPGDALFARLAEIRTPIDEEDEMLTEALIDAAVERWNKLVAGQASPRPGHKITATQPETRAKALGEKLADGLFASMKGQSG